MSDDSRFVWKDGDVELLNDAPEEDDSPAFMPADPDARAEG